MRLPRLTTRRLMALVAVVGLGAGGYRLWSRCYFHFRQARAWADLESTFREFADGDEYELRHAERWLKETTEHLGSTHPDASFWRSELEDCRRKLRYNRAFAKYWGRQKDISLRAVAHPWENVQAPPNRPDELDPFSPSAVDSPPPK